MLTTKILKLHIENLRGIVNLDLNFNGKNAVIYGPNGVGKSAVADAIDFLLTGNITRLSGNSTGELTLINHGPHVGFAPAEAKVIAEMQSVNGHIFIVERSISRKEAVITPETSKIDFGGIGAYAQTGAHFLSRRELLNYILTTPGERAIQIQTLLNISDLKTNHSIFLKLKKKVDAEELEANRILTIQKAALLKNVGAEITPQLLAKINEHRSILGGSQLDEIGDGDFTDGLMFNDTKDNTDIAECIHLIEELIEYIPTLAVNIETKISAIRIILKKIGVENVTQLNADTVALINAGIALVDDSGRCPLCQHQWATKEELQRILMERRQKSEKLSSLINDYKVAISELDNVVASYRKKIVSLITILKLRDNISVNELENEQVAFQSFEFLRNCSVNDFVDKEKVIVDFVKQRNSEELVSILNKQLVKLRPLLDDMRKEKIYSWQSLNKASWNYKQIIAADIRARTLAITKKKPNTS